MKPVPISGTEVFSALNELVRAKLSDASDAYRKLCLAQEALLAIEKSPSNHSLEEYHNAKSALIWADFFYKSIQPRASALVEMRDAIGDRFGWGSLAEQPAEKVAGEKEE